MTTAASEATRLVKRRSPIAIKAGDIGPDGSFAGYGSVFGVVDSYGDVVVKGAFAGSLSRRGPAGVRMLWQHDPGYPIGVWTEMREDDTGLWCAGRLLLDVEKAREAHVLLKNAAIDGLSIGYETLVCEWASPAAYEAKYGSWGMGYSPPASDQVRVLSELDLWEVSPVTFQACEPARVQTVKATADRRVTPALPAALVAALQQRAALTERIASKGATMFTMPIAAPPARKTAEEATIRAVIASKIERQREMLEQVRSNTHTIAAWESEGAERYKIDSLRTLSSTFLHLMDQFAADVLGMAFQARAESSSLTGYLEEAVTMMLSMFDEAFALAEAAGIDYAKAAGTPSRKADGMVLPADVQALVDQVVATYADLSVTVSGTAAQIDALFMQAGDDGDFVHRRVQWGDYWRIADRLIHSRKSGAAPARKEADLLGMVAEIQSLVDQAIAAYDAAAGVITGLVEQVDALLTEAGNDSDYVYRNVKWGSFISIAEFVVYSRR